MNVGDRAWSFLTNHARALLFLADDPETRAIACYMEAIQDGERFAAAVKRARENGKPVIAMKVGGSEIGAAAAASHPASLAGRDAVYDAALRQLGVERAKTPDNLSATARMPLRTRSAKAEEQDPVTTAATVVVEELDAKGAIAPTRLDWRLFWFECGAPSHHLR